MIRLHPSGEVRTNLIIYKEKRRPLRIPVQVYHNLMNHTLKSTHKAHTLMIHVLLLLLLCRGGSSNGN